MKTAQVAAIVEDPASGVATTRLGRILDFLGISWETLPCKLQPPIAGSDRKSCAYQSILAPISAAADLWPVSGFPLARSLFFYTGKDRRTSSESLAVLTGCKEDALRKLDGETIDVVVATDWSALTGPMHGLKPTVKVRSSDRVAAIRSAGLISNIIDTQQGSLFFCCTNGDSRAFVTCSSEIPDVAERLTGKGYDVREQFSSAVPLLMYLKWSFRDVCWQSNEPGACLIVDDPLLRTNYGYCNFPLLDQQMKRHSFTTNIAMIPWNARRTSPAMASLVRNSGGRLSVSVHGCDHTAQEFKIENADELGAKIDLAGRRMEYHRSRTGIAHDSIMVFPQGIFSRESLRSLQEHEFVAAVNTETIPFRREDEVLAIEDTWSVAINRYGSFPLFTRRYPADGLANFAFDILLGKPCLIVEHHSFFKGEHQNVVRFVNALNSMNGGLRWRSLGDVIRRSYQWRLGPNRVVQVRMFANELLLKNDDNVERQYQIEKADEGSAGVREVTADGRYLEWTTDGHAIVFICQIPSGAEVLIQVRYNSRETKAERRNGSRSNFVKIAARRYLSEFRDNFLARHDRIMAIAQKAKRMASRS